MKHVNKVGMSTEAIEQMWTDIAGAPKIERPKIAGSTKTRRPAAPAHKQVSKYHKLHTAKRAATKESK
jgi:hypothetical protein